MAASEKKPDDVRVAILGTSNSLMRDGYVIGLKKRAGIKVVANASLGSSHAPMLAYRLPALEKVEFDTLILDLCINEQRAVDRGLYDLNLTTKIFKYFLSWCADRKVTPVVLILPDQNGLNGLSADPKTNKVYRHYVEMCETWKVPYFDGYQFVKGLAKSRDVAVTSLFKDTYHLAPEVAQRLGKALAKPIKVLATTPAFGWTLTRSHSYKYVSVPQEHALERSTSIATVRFARMGIDSQLQIECPPRCGIVAVALNMSQTNAALRISGKDHLIKRFDNAYYDASRSMWLVIWSLLRPVGTGSGSVRVSVEPSSLTSGQEDNDHSRPNQLPPDDQEAIVEIAGFIVQSPQRWRFRFNSRYKVTNLLKISTQRRRQKARRKNKKE